MADASGPAVMKLESDGSFTARKLAPSVLEKLKLPKLVTLKAVADTLQTLESEQSLVAAKRFAAYLDYDRLTDLAKKGAAYDPDDDPSVVPDKYIVLFGMSGDRVEAFQKALGKLDHSCDVTKKFDDATLEAYLDWLETARQDLPPKASIPSGATTATVRAGDTFPSIARANAIDDWHDLHALNEAAVPNPDLLKPGTTLKIPAHDDWKRGKELLEAAGVDAKSYYGGRWFLSPLVIVSTTVVDSTGKPLPAGAAYKLIDEDDEVAHEGTLAADGIWAELPRLEYRIEVDGKVVGRIFADGGTYDDFLKSQQAAKSDLDGSPAVNDAAPFGPAAIYKKLLGV